ncbi:MAG: hypothetical protein V7L14_04520 [Nostoc sp.]|uniref:hypothetical protein n=1 Tax=Nostoc sp. TaxID=1180 RepID=UPI002FFA70D6
MKDQKKLAEQLKNRAIDSDHEQVLADLGEQLITEFEDGSSKAVTEMISSQIEQQRKAYNRSLQALTVVMGL